MTVKGVSVFYVILSMKWWDETGKQTIDIKGRLMCIAFQLPRIPISKADFLELVTFIVASFYGEAVVRFLKGMAIVELEFPYVRYFLPLGKTHCRGVAPPSAALV